MALLLKSPFLSTAIVTPSRRSLRRVSLPIRMKVDCRKQGLHPTYFEDTKVYCDGELVMVTGGTQKELTVDAWSGNHAFFLGQSMGADDDDFFLGQEDWSLYDVGGGGEQKEEYEEYEEEYEEEEEEENTE